MNFSSMICRVIAVLFLLVQLNLNAQNVRISKRGYFVEPSIAMDLHDPNIIVAGSVLNHYHISKDGGKTWKTNTLKSPYGVYGDPVIEIDTLGNFYYLHLSNTPGGSWIDRIVCQKSTDQGQTWNDGSFVGLNGTKAQDKHWTVVDHETNTIYVTWTEFDKYGSEEVKDSSRILFSKSEDQGETWAKPVQINQISGDCIDSDNTLEGATPAVGPNGEVYVAWAGPQGLVFTKSEDRGKTWLKEEVIIDSIPGGWDFNIGGLSRANGLPIVKCDLSVGENHGTIYVNWADQRNGEHNTDIWLVQSKDGGKTWTKPVKVNDDQTERQQFFTWMDIDQVTGHLYFVFYDRRAYDNDKTDVYLAVSNDGGLSFKNIKISDKPFTPKDKAWVFFGDYNNIVAHNNVVRPIWTRYDRGKTSVWTNITDLNTLLQSVGK